MAQNSVQNRNSKQAQNSAKTAAVIPPNIEVPEFIRDSCDVVMSLHKFGYLNFFLSDNLNATNELTVIHPVPLRQNIGEQTRSCTTGIEVQQKLPCLVPALYLLC